jgi:hypothetical protein
MASKQLSFSFYLALKVFTLNQIRDLVIVVLTTFLLLPALLLLQALIALRQPSQTS